MTTWTETIDGIETDAILGRKVEVTSSNPEDPTRPYVVRTYTYVDGGWQLDGITRAYVRLGYAIRYAVNVHRTFGESMSPGPIEPGAYAQLQASDCGNCGVSIHRRGDKASWYHTSGPTLPGYRNCTLGYSDMASPSHGINEVNLIGPMHTGTDITWSVGYGPAEAMLGFTSDGMYLVNVVKSRVDAWYMSVVDALSGSVELELFATDEVAAVALADQWSHHRL